MKLLSVVIPAYNEERTLGTLLKKIQDVPVTSVGFNLEIIVVDDGSADRTLEIASSFREVRCLKQKNQGKGAAVQSGVKASTGEYLLVQDADLEYNPSDYLPMLGRLPDIGWAVVYGNRRAHSGQSFGPRLANLLLSLWTLALYGRWIGDPLTAYKLYPTHLVRDMKVKSSGFEADHEMTAKLIRRGIPIFQVPIDYAPRSIEDGKKIRAMDGVIAVWTLLKYRFMS